MKRNLQTAPPASSPVDQSAGDYRKTAPVSPSIGAVLLNAARLIFGDVRLEIGCPHCGSAVAAHTCTKPAEAVKALDEFLTGADRRSDSLRYFGECASCGRVELQQSRYTAAGQCPKCGDSATATVKDAHPFAAESYVVTRRKRGAHRAAVLPFPSQRAEEPNNVKVKKCQR